MAFVSRNKLGIVEGETGNVSSGVLDNIQKAKAQNRFNVYRWAFRVGLHSYMLLILSNKLYDVRAYISK